MSEATIICRAKAGLGSQWLTVVGTPGAWRVEATSNHLESPVNSLTQELSRDWTFTDRALDDALASYVETPARLEDLGLNSHAVIFCPEGAPVENRWATLHRAPATGAIVGPGIEGKFRPRPDVLREKVLEYFVKLQWRSFQPQKVSERHEPVGQQPHRPSHRRELLIRHNWSARSIAPHAFDPVRSGPIVTDEQASRRISRMPQNKAAARRAKHQEADARFKAEAAERARQREAAT